MTRKVLFVLLGLGLLMLLSGCTSGNKKYSSTPEGHVQNFEVSVPEYTISGILINSTNIDNQFISTKGVVEKTVAAGMYTYAKISDGTGEIWVAGPKTNLKPGSKVKLYGALVVLNFKSPALNKTIDVLLMTQSFGSGESSLHGTTEGNSTSAVNVSVKKLAGGYTISDIFTRSKDLAGKEIEFRGVITKVLPEIMNKTWIHLQDGTKDNVTGENEIKVTYSGPEKFKVGDVVIVKGKLETDVNIGSGYFFRVLINNATIKKDET
ncbi:hypothetical protein BMS3Bbin15_01873 [archaeon BMS3Bbin15]|nr:hypothetical protein BMS3Bbin15_01873 [archaeon BMS3Bbin15]